MPTPPVAAAPATPLPEKRAPAGHIVVLQMGQRYACCLRARSTLWVKRGEACLLLPARWMAGHCLWPQWTMHEGDSHLLTETGTVQLLAVKACTIYILPAPAPAARWVAALYSLLQRPGPSGG